MTYSVMQEVEWNDTVVVKENPLIFMHRPIGEFSVVENHSQLTPQVYPTHKGTQEKPSQHNSIVNKKD